VTKECTWERDTCPKQECHKLRVVDGDRDEVAVHMVRGRWKWEFKQISNFTGDPN
jgi:hypothetical protein